VGGVERIKSAVLRFPLITEGDKGVKKYEQSLEGRFYDPPVLPI
jgi:hypothetical protein